VLLGARLGLFAIVDIPVRTRICVMYSVVHDLFAVSDSGSHTAQQDQNQRGNFETLSPLETADRNPTHFSAPATLQTRIRL
jgi:hypothetical protein